MKHLLGFGLASLPIEPLLCYHFFRFCKREELLAGVVADTVDFLLDLLAVHLRESEVAEDTSQVVAADKSLPLRVVEVERILDLVLLSRATELPCPPKASPAAAL